MKKILSILAIAVVAVAVIIIQLGRQQHTNAVDLSPLFHDVKVAVLMPLTGPQAGIGRGCANSVKLAFDRAKQELAAKHVRVQLVMLDDGSKPETAVAAAQRVTSDAEFVLSVAHFNSPCALATVDIFHESGMPMIVPAAVNSGITAKGYPEVFRSCNTDVQQAVYMAQFLLETKQVERIYAIHDSSAFGKGLIDALGNELAKQGRAFSGQDAFKTGDVDFSAVVTRAQAASPDIIVLGCMAGEGALLRRQMAEKRVSVPVVGFSGIFYDTFLKNAGDAAEGTMTIFPLPPLEEIPGGKAYQDAYTAAGFEEPYESAGPFGYVAGQVAAAALAGSDISRAGLVQTLHSSTFETAFGPLMFAENGEMNLKMFCFYTVKDGRWVPTHNVNENGTIVPVVNP